MTNNYFSARPLLTQWLIWSTISLTSCSVNVLSILYEMSSFTAWGLTLLLLLPGEDRLAQPVQAAHRRAAGLFRRAGLAFPATLC